MAGRKRWFLSTEESVERAVSEGVIPRGVIEEGNTHNFAEEGQQADVFRSVGGSSVLLEEGDALLLPAGLYHDVASESAALSITIRFELPVRCDGTKNCARPSGHWGQHIEAVEERAQEGSPTPKSLFARWRNAVSEGEETKSNDVCEKKDGTCTSDIGID